MGVMPAWYTAHAVAMLYASIQSWVMVLPAELTITSKRFTSCTCKDPAINLISTQN